MNKKNINPESKSAAIKTLAIFGFVAIIVGGVWLSVKVVNIAPSAFSSLASIVEGLENKKDRLNTLSITTEKNIINSQEAFTISWTNLNRNGLYSFNHACTEGVSTEMRKYDGTIIFLECGTNTELNSDIQSLDLIISSEKKRFVDVSFTISFTQEDENESFVSKEKTITIVNATIPQSIDLLSTDVDTEAETTDFTTKDTEPLLPDTPTIPSSTQVATPVYVIPQSSPEGFVDLNINYTGVGTLVDTDFIPSGTIDNDSKGAIRFKVTNIGTKTSETWTFASNLPNGNIFTSLEQAPLSPNETATLTIGFNLTDTTGSQGINISIDTDGDTNNNNDSFSWSVNIID